MPFPNLLSTLKPVFLSLTDPWIFLLEALSHLPRTLLTHPQLVLRDPSAFRDAWFSAFWATAGPGVCDNAKTRVLPLLQGRVHAGKVLPDAAAASAAAAAASAAAAAAAAADGAPRPAAVAGVVLELGPDPGLWAPLFAALRDHRQPLDKVYGIEPNVALHPALQRSLVEAGLSDMYEIVPVGVEGIASSGKVQRGSVDCIVSVLCLCSIPEPERNVAELFDYLKPGGRWFVYEHVRCGSWTVRESGLAMRVYQAFINLFWPKIVNGCELCRNTAKTLMEAGSWSKIDLAQPEGEPWYQPLPHVLGTLTK